MTEPDSGYIDDLDLFAPDRLTLLSQLDQIYTQFVVMYEDDSHVPVGTTRALSVLPFGQSEQGTWLPDQPSDANQRDMWENPTRLRPSPLKLSPLTMAGIQGSTGVVFLDYP